MGLILPIRPSLVVPIPRLVEPDGLVDLLRFNPAKMPSGMALVGDWSMDAATDDGSGKVLQIADAGGSAFTLTATGAGRRPAMLASSAVFGGKAAFLADGIDDCMTNAGNIWPLGDVTMALLAAANGATAGCWFTSQQGGGDLCDFMYGAGRTFQRWSTGPVSRSLTDGQPFVLIYTGAGHLPAATSEEVYLYGSGATGGLEQQVVNKRPAQTARALVVASGTGFGAFPRAMYFRRGLIWSGIASAADRDYIFAGLKKDGGIA